VACDDDDAVDEQAAQVRATTESYQITLDPATVPAGEVTFNVTNLAGVDHEFEVLDTDTPVDQLPVNEDGEVEVDEFKGIDAFHGPNVTRQMTADLKPGAYAIICNIPGHYQQGMRTVLVVQ
jgi:uncharacterized cupredoxin-like copper-binding protein